MIVLGFLGSSFADILGAFFYIFIGGLVVFEMEWLMGVWWFLQGLGVIGIFIGPLFGTLAGLLAYKLNKRIITPSKAAFFGGAIPIALIWFYLFIKIWIESVQLRGR